MVKMAEGGVRKGFIILKVNNIPMKTVEDLEKVMKEAAKTQEQVLFITGMCSPLENVAAMQ